MTLNYSQRNLEIIVVDGGSTDNTMEIAQNYPVKIVLENKRGRGAAYNFGFTIAKGDYVAYVDSDAYVLPNWLCEVMAILQKDAKIGAVFTQNVAPENCNFIQKSIDLLNSIGRGQANGAVYRKEALQRAGGFNESIHYLQETELRQKFSILGYTSIFLANPVIYHVPRKSIISYMYQSFEVGVGRFQLLRANGYKGTISIAKSLLYPLIPLIIGLEVFLSCISKNYFVFGICIMLLSTFFLSSALIIYLKSVINDRKFYHIIVATLLGYFSAVVSLIGFVKEVLFSNKQIKV